MEVPPVPSAGKNLIEVQADKPTPRSETVKAYVIAAVITSCALIIICGGLQVSGKLPHPGNFVMIGGIMLGSGGLLGSAILMSKVRGINNRIDSDGDDKGDTKLAAAIRKMELGKVRRYLWMGANPFTKGAHGSAIDIAKEEGKEQALDYIKKYGYKV